jgi:capsular polysaccharide biosynthesis protein
MSFEHNFDSKYIIEVSNVVVNTEANHVYVCGHNRNDFYLLKESVSWPTDVLIINAEKPSKKIRQIIGHVKLGLPNSGYFHWLSEDLPNYLLDDSKNDCLVYKKSKLMNYLVLQKQKENILECNKWVFVKKLSFVTRFGELGYIHPSSVVALEKYSSSIKSKAYSHEKIYVSRTKTRRSIRGENLIEEYLSNRGFAIIYSEELTFEDQIQIFTKAKIIVGLHGAGLANTIWSKDYLLVEIMPINRVNRCIEWHVSLRGDTYRRIYFDPKNYSVNEIISDLDLLVH